jgi:zinc protease
VSIHRVLPAGAERDLPGRGGAADLAAEMLTLGTKEKTASQWAATIDGLGASASARAGWNYSAISFFGLSEDFETLMGLLLETCTEPAFAGDEFEQLKKRRLDALWQQKDESSVIAEEKFQEILFRGTPYGHAVYGSLKSLPSLAVEEVKALYQGGFEMEGGFLVVVGDVDPEACFRWADTHFPPSEAKGKMVDLGFSPPPRVGRSIFLVERPDLTQSQIRLGHIGIPHAHPDYRAFEVMNYILGGGGFSSRLMQRVRVERGFTYGIRGSLEPRKTPGPFTVATFTPTQTTFPCVQEIFSVFQSFREQGATEREREEATNFLTGSYPMKFETPAQIAQRIIQAKLHGLGLESLVRYPEEVGAISLPEIIRAAREYLHPEDMQIVVVGRTEGFRRDFESLGPVEIAGE